VRKKPIKTRNFVMVIGGVPLALTTNAQKLLQTKQIFFIANVKRKKKNLKICK
jgi:hypothetical protein